jgi:cleavage and polyadenylation specificity factor subunit 2
LKAAAYSTLPVQAMGKIAAIEDVEGVRDEQDIGDEPVPEMEHTEIHPEENDEAFKETSPKPQTKSGRYISTLVEVQDAFEYLNTLRYSQPTHLQGVFFIPPSSSLSLTQQF